MVSPSQRCSQNSEEASRKVWVSWVFQVDFSDSRRPLLSVLRGVSGESATTSAMKSTYICPEDLLVHAFSYFAMESIYSY